ncbi:MAG: hypothetical protein MJ179_07005 [Treponema sp.]|nr:hypothetical protein [Treponema sp.]
MDKKALIHVEKTENLLEFASFLTELGWKIYTANKNEELLKQEGIPVITEPLLSERNIYGTETFKLIRQIHSTKLPQEVDGTILEEDMESGFYIVCLNIDPHYSISAADINYQQKLIPLDLQISIILRSAFINYQNILILTDPADYKEAMIQLRTGSVSNEFRTYLAAKALSMVSSYDAGLANSLMAETTHKDEFMKFLTYPLTKVMELKNGTNKQQESCLYAFPSTPATSTFFSKLQGKDFDYTTISDLSFAWDAINFLYQQLKNQYSVKSTNCEGYNYTTQFTPITGTVSTIAVKYRTIIGASLSTNILDSFKNTYKYGSSISDVTLGCSSVVDKIAAEEMIKCNFVAIIAPDFTEEARQVFENSQTKLVPTAKFAVSKYDIKKINSGILVQTKDTKIFEHWNIKTKERPAQYIVDEMAFGMMLAMRSKSHCAILLKNNTITGIGQGCITAKKAIDTALLEAKDYLANNMNTGTIADLLVCDSTTELTDSIKELIENGLSAIIQTGTNCADDNFINYCNEHGIVMIYTNMTHITL